MKKISTYLKNFHKTLSRNLVVFVTWYKQQSKKRKLGIVAIGLVVVVAILKIILGRDGVTAETKVTNRKVAVASVASLSNSDKGFPLVGTVTSLSEATIRSESGGKLTYVSKKLGDMVYAGGVIAELENSGEKAALLQAEGAYDQAKAARNIASLNSGQAGTSLNDTKNQALNAVINAYTTIEDAVRGKTDSAYTDPKFEQVKLLLSVPDANLATSLEVKRKAIEKILVARELKNKTLTQSSDLSLELNSALADSQTIKSYLDDLYTGYSKALPDSNFTQTAIDAGKTNTQTARQSVATTISGLVTMRTTLSASVTANQVAGTDSQSQSSGSLATADAQVKQALGAYNGALARLEKTIIRSPITGTLNSLSISTGDFITAFAQVAVVSNNGALEVISFVTDDDAKRIAVGSPVTIDGTVAGVITRIASAIDPTTKKIEVRIGIKDVKSTLTNGQSVRILISQDKKNQNIVTKKAGPIIIPIAALKLTPRGGNVFIVSATNTLVALPVHEGAIMGEEIQILDGLNGDEVIVTDARGLKEGQVVETDTK
jgi:multidrug efflux pump subunit AcrA (membrane-fusion protein)